MMTSKKKKSGDMIQAELRRDERLLWSGRPQQGVMFRPYDMFLIPFSLFWGGFACFWTLAATAGGGCFGLFGLPFVAVGVYLTVGRFWLDMRQRDNTYYAITDQRALIVSGIRSQQIKSLNLHTLTDVSLDLKPDGRGTITFGAQHPMANTYRGMNWPGLSQTIAPAFEGIDHARAAYDHILAAQHVMRGADQYE